MTDLLEVKNLRAAYGGIVAVANASLTVAEGEIVGLLGANGGGKSTLLGCVLGLVRSSGGTVTFGGQQIGSWPTERIVEAGIAMVPEGRGVLGGMTVEENLLMGGYSQRLGRKEAKERIDRSVELFPILGEKLGDEGRSLSGGQKQMLLIARCLMSRPRLLVLDEPSLGLAPLIVRGVFDLVASLCKTEGLSVLVSEQNARAALRVVDRGYILERGRVVLEGPADELRSSEQLTAAYLGG